MCHPRVHENVVERRAYQENIVAECQRQNTLVVLPTALGKTMIAILTAVERLDQYPWTKVLVLAPTRPLVSQHHASFQKILEGPEEQFLLLSSRIPARSRAYFWDKAQFVFSTPQIIKNDLEKGRYDLSQISLLVLDEVHKSRRTYAYIPIADAYHANCPDPVVLGLTASPGKNRDRIVDLLHKIRFEHVECRDDTDPDVLPYIHDINVLYEKVSLPGEYCHVLGYLDDLLWHFAKKLVTRHLLPVKAKYSKMAFLELAQELQAEISTTFEEAEKRPFYRALKYAFACVSILHATELLVVQDFPVFWKFVEKIQRKADRGSPASKAIASHPLFEDLVAYCQETPVPAHPKLERLEDLLVDVFEEDPRAKVIVFAQYRDTAARLVRVINEQFSEHLPVRAVRFVGQAHRPDDPGLNQQQQKEIIDEFAGGTWNVLVATSVAEEGLDIPNVDHVVFWEAVPSEIRLIQRRGRTGRHREGNCYILFTQNSLDHIYLAVSHRREENMRQTLGNLDSWTLPLPITRVPIVKPAPPDPTSEESPTGPNSYSQPSYARPRQDSRGSRGRRKIRRKRKKPPKTRYLSKMGKWIYHTIESCAGDGISAEEIYELAEFEELELDQLEWELKRVVGSTAIEEETTPTGNTVYVLQTA